MGSRKRSSGGTPTTLEATYESSALQALQDFPDIWAGWQKDGAIRQGNDGSCQNSEPSSNLSPIQTLRRDARFRKSLQNPIFVESLLRLKAEMERASQAPLRQLVIYYRADEPLYSSEEVVVHFSMIRTLQEFLDPISQINLIWGVEERW